jgi:exodeoxyribonuclease V alpha subunit
VSSIINIRVTSVWQNTKDWVCFAGVPIKTNSSRILDGRKIVIVKTTPKILPLEPVKGQHWRISGDYNEKKVAHGDYYLTEQHWYQPEKCEVTLPHDGEQFIRFIANETAFKGIGEVKARDLWRKFGSKIFNILENKEVDKLNLILNAKLVVALINGYEKYANLKYSTWFADHKIPPRIQHRLFKYHKENAIESIKTNPYILINFGMSFEDVDNIALIFPSITDNDSRRLIAAIDVALKIHAKKGHTYAMHDDLLPIVSKILNSYDLAVLALKEGHNKLSFVIDPKKGSYHSMPLYIMERVIAKRFNHLIDSRNCYKDQLIRAYKKEVIQSAFQFTEMQYKAITSSIENSLSCITGGAGTGKTTVLRTVLRIYKNCGFDIFPLALSGRAAMRLHESIGFVTYTIARFLRMKPIEGDSKSIIVIDESSMLDLSTMYQLIIHVDPSVRFLLVGDSHQLPPIGPGCILLDLIRSTKVKFTELDIILRQKASTGIPEYSQLIKKGIIPSNLSYKNVRFADVNSEDVPQYCTNLYSQNSERTIVIAPTKQITNKINLLCQHKVNGGLPKLAFEEFGEIYITGFSLGDPVLFTKNNYELGVQNGTLGKIVSIEQKEEQLGIIEIDGTEEEIILNRNLLDSIVLGYCITLHKAQGSQFNRVIVAITNSQLIDRAWLYTAITRSESELHLVGLRHDLEKGIVKESSQYLRNSFLSELIL